jgi:hypothetical protein
MGRAGMSYNNVLESERERLKPFPEVVPDTFYFPILRIYSGGGMISSLLPEG